jgi:hypothetical protein
MGLVGLGGGQAGRRGGQVGGVGGQAHIPAPPAPWCAASPGSSAAQSWRPRPCSVLCSWPCSRPTSPSPSSSVDACLCRCPRPSRAPTPRASSPAGTATSSPPPLPLGDTTKSASSPGRAGADAPPPCSAACSARRRAWNRSSRSSRHAVSRCCTAARYRPRVSSCSSELAPVRGDVDRARGEWPAGPMGGRGLRPPPPPPPLR